MNRPFRTRAIRLAAAAAAAAAAAVVSAAPASAAQTVPINERGYTAKVIGIKSFDETGPFNSGLSDEIFGRFQVEPLQRIDSRLFGDFDAGESRVVPADQQCMVGSVVRVNNGPSILSGRTGDSWTCATVGKPGPIIIHGELFEQDSGGDEFLGRKDIVLTNPTLAADIPNLGAVRNYTSDFTGAGGHYRVTYQLQRVF